MSTAVDDFTKRKPSRIQAKLSPASVQATRETRPLSLDPLPSSLCSVFMATKAKPVGHWAHSPVRRNHFWWQALPELRKWN